MSRIRCVCLLGLLSLGLILAGCKPSQPRVADSPLPAPLPMQSPLAIPASEGSAELPTVVPTWTPAAVQTPKPGAGLAAVTGMLYTSTGKGSIPDTSFYLMLATDEIRSVASPREEDGDIRGRSDLEGRFVLNNVPPGKYYLFVWAPFSWIPVPVSASDETLRVFDLQPDRVNDLGQVALPWP